MVLEKDVIRWNTLFPLDSWYRRRYNLRFNSPEHREVSQIDVYFEWIEFKLLEQNPQKRQQEKSERESNIKLIPKGRFLIPQKQKEELLQDEIDLFDKIDIDSLNESLNG